MSIPTDDRLHLAREGTGQEDVVLRVLADTLGQWEGVDDLGSNCHKVNQGQNIDAFVFVAEPHGDLPVLRQDLRTGNQLNPVVAPRLQDSVWRPGEEDAGDEHVRIQHDSHRRFRTSASAAVMSARLSPAVLA